MSTTVHLIALLKSELRSAGITYAALAERLGMAESSVKRMFAKGGDMPLSRIDDICRVLNVDFADLARRIARNGGVRVTYELADAKSRRLSDHCPVGVDLELR